MKELLIGKKYLAMRTLVAFIGGIIFGLMFYDFSILIEPAGTAFMNMIKMLMDMIPTNIVQAMAEQNIMALVFFTVICGICMVLLGEKAEMLVKICSQCAEVTYKMLDVIMIYAPIGIFALMANTMAQYGPKIFGSMAKYLACVWIGAVVAWFVFSGFTAVYTKTRYSTLCKVMIPIWTNTLATTSSAGTIPITLNVLTKKLHVPESLASFSIPLGATINLSGAAIQKTALALFVCQIYGIDLSVPQLVMMIVMATLVCIAAPGIPGGGVITSAIFLSMNGLPLDLMGAIAGMYRLMDMSNTSINVSGDVLGSMIVAKNERIWDGSQARTVEEEY